MQKRWLLLSLLQADGTPAVWSRVGPRHVKARRSHPGDRPWRPRLFPLPAHSAGDGMPRFAGLQERAVLEDVTEPSAHTSCMARASLRARGVQGREPSRSSHIVCLNYRILCPWEGAEARPGWGGRMSGASPSVWLGGGGPSPLGSRALGRSSSGHGPLRVHDVR